MTTPAGMERACPKCERMNRDRDFCADCGEYLRWEPTRYLPALRDDGGQGAPVLPVLRAALLPTVTVARPRQAPATMILRGPGGIGPDGQPQLAVEPGAAGRLAALIRNESAIVDNYDLVVVGLPDGWWSVTPGTVYLVPFGANAGRSEQEVDVAIHPPRIPEAEAREWPIQVVARSRATGVEVASAQAVVTIAPYRQLTGALRPERRSGRRRAQYTLRVANQANAPVTVLLDAIDPDNHLTASFFTAARPGQKAIDPTSGANLVQEMGRLGVGRTSPEYMARMALTNAMSGRSGLTRFFRRRKANGGQQPVVGLEIGPGERVQALLRVTPARQKLVGRGVLHPFQVTVDPTQSTPGDPPGPVVPAVFKQRPWIPWWVLVLLPLIVLGLLLFLMTRPTLTTVPNLTNTPDQLAADAALGRAKLKLGDTLQIQNDKAAPGSVIGQSPAAGTRLEQGSVVSVKLAVSSGKGKIPKITGLTMAQAGTILTQGGFQLGAALSPPANAATSTITSQVPVEGTEAALGSPVNPVFGRPRTPGPKSGPGPRPTPAPVPGPSSGPPAAPGGGGPRVPDLVGDTQDAAAKQVIDKGYLPETDGEVSDTVPLGTVIRQHPPANAAFDRGGTVRIVVSLGYPEVIYDVDQNIVAIGGARGRPQRELAATADVEIHPSVSQDGALLAYRRGPATDPDPQKGPAQIWIMDPKDPASARPLTSAGFDDRRPAISPNGEVVAFTSNRGAPEGDTDLCVVSLVRAPAEPSCIADPAIAVSRPSWAPDGRSIVVTARVQEQTELVQYMSARRSSPVATDWVSQGVVTDAMHGPTPNEQVTSSAFSPDHETLAVAANWNDGVFKVYLIPVRNGAIAGTAKPLATVAACELAWRPDLGASELVVARRDQSCDGSGQIVRLDVTRPEKVTQLTQVARNSANPVFGFGQGR